MASKRKKFGHNGLSNGVLTVDAPVFDDFIYRPVLLDGNESTVIAKVASQIQASRIEHGSVGVDGQIRVPIITIDDLRTIILQDPELLEDAIANSRYEIKNLYQEVKQGIGRSSSLTIKTPRSTPELREGDLIAELGLEELKNERLAARHAVCEYFDIAPPSTECRQPYVQIARLIDMKNKGSELVKTADKALPNPLKLGRLTLAKSITIA